MGGYSDSLNLPDTKFPMRANLAAREPDMLKHNQQTDLYGRIRKTVANRPSFVLHDGPPYANGNIHLGHVVNKVLKDFVWRSKLIQGFDASYIPGWDCHGLPIERQLEKQKVSKADPIEFRRRCRQYADEQISTQRVEFERLGVLGDWHNHYRTMEPRTEGDIVRTLGKLLRTGLVYHGLRPVLHCAVCQSSLAEAEIEYAERTSIAVDVRYRACDDQQVAKVFGLAQAPDAAAVIWTTTAWTLPASRCIAIHPELEYAALRTELGTLIIAKSLVQQCLERWQIEGEVLATIKGASLDKLDFRHPFLNRITTAFIADHVTSEEGTGLVHTAPAHGEDDFLLGTRHGLESSSPIDKQGRYYDWVEKFAGLDVWQAVPKIVDELRSQNALLAKVNYRHSYPVCWRHKSPIIFRTSKQWFLAMDKAPVGKTRSLRELALAAIDASRFYPSWGKERFAAMVVNRPDWCLSRQRMWNSPVAVFIDRKTGELHPRTEELIEQIATKVDSGGIEAWFAMSAEELLGAEADHYEKVTDTLDVWFDSGVTHQAVMHWQGGDANRPDMYLEGSDQHRGWFMSSLITACALYGEPPWRELLTHGFVVGGDGRKMSKSVGNVLAPDKLFNKYGADILRMWVATADYSQEIKLSEEILRTNIDAYRLLRNRIRFMLANLADFDLATDALPLDQLAQLDRYMIVQAERCRKKVAAAYEEYSFLTSMKELHVFCNQDLGRFYLDILKDRLYTLPANCRARRSAQTAMYHITRMLLIGLGPMLSFTADEAWQVFTDDPKQSTMLHILDELPTVADASKLEVSFACLRKWRTKLSGFIEQARITGKIDCPDVELAIKVTAPEPDYSIMADFAPADLAGIMIVSAAIVSLGDEAIEVRKSELAKCSRCWRRDIGVGTGDNFELCTRCEQALAGIADDQRQV